MIDCEEKKMNRMMNRMMIAKNPYQGETKKVLTICSAGILRSPTAAKVIAEEYGYNTRAAGAEEEFALIPVSEVLLEWADEIVFMEQRHYDIVKGAFENEIIERKCKVLDVPDIYPWNDPKLVAAIKEQYAATLEE